MCGICGVWYFDGRPVNAALLHAMTDTLAHRGPDSAGYHIDGSLGLGFRRLSIVDIEGSGQPIASPDGSLHLACNGEIYNYRELRAQFASTYNFRTHGDAECILCVYTHKAINCINDLRGMFAFALHDSQRDRLLLAVDRFGKKPLYYLLDDDRLIFASELKAILKHPDVAREIDREALDEYLTYGHITAPRTIFRAVRKLEAGHGLVVTRDGHVEKRRYWQPTFAAKGESARVSLADAAADVRDLLSEAVRLRLMGDVPVGAFLSGGVDSSAVVALMQQHSSQPVKTFSIGFEDAAYDESRYAQAVARHFGTDHTCVTLTPDMLLDALPALSRQFDEPFADASMLPTYWVSRVARERVTVALGGDGGDEVFGGYAWYTYANRHALLQRLIPVSARPLAAKVGRHVPQFSKLRPYLSVVDQPVAYWGTTFTGFFNAAERAGLYTDDARAALGGYAGEGVKIEAFRRVGDRLDWLAQMQHADLAVYLPSDILVKVDRASMLHSLEVRSPLLDHGLFEYVATLPPHYRRTLRESKIVLKRAVGDLLPEAVLTRSKQGFGIPQREWLAGALKPLVCDTLTSAAARERGLFDPRYVDELLAAHDTARRHDYRLWALLGFELWAREYLDA